MLCDCRKTPVIDLFAGSGGLGEGFASAALSGKPRFHLNLSIECNSFAHQTLTLRAFCREFTGSGKRLPKAYARHLRGDLSRADLFGLHPKEAEAAIQEACLARLGEAEGDALIADRILQIQRAGIDFRRGVMIGGPPCQAYSLVGRSRLARAKASGEYREENDGRHVLYKQYLRLLEELQPAVFVMENVRGILSSTYNGRPIFGQILTDLSEAGYDLHALGEREADSLFGADDDPRSYLLVASDFGVPQRRARVFIVGTRKDLRIKHLKLISKARTHKPATVQDAISDLPPLRSGLSTDDSFDAWCSYVRSFALRLAHDLPKSLADMATLLEKIGQPRSRLPMNRRAETSDSEAGSGFIANHETRGHIPADLERYLFYSAWGATQANSPSLSDLPRRLLPDHKNVAEAMKSESLDEVAFSDRFRVQLAHEPSTTITSHIAKDGHYFIHPDPRQCRSLTVREAARLQTFPDDYYFCGARTEQYRQVGNSVPPRLARRVALAIQALDLW
ncbi:MAG: DNA cytosine methyltransferase [Betaproteobacteria bacterium]|nr:DNA cytosine methyltransferase [Betaproteobacteria bacterium]